MVSQQNSKYVLELKRFSEQYKPDVLAGNSLDDIIEKRVKSDVNIRSEGLRKLYDLAVEKNQLLEKQLVQIAESLGQFYDRILNLNLFRNYEPINLLNKEVVKLSKEKRDLENLQWKNNFDLIQNIIYHTKDYNKAKYNALSLLEA